MGRLSTLGRVLFGCVLAVTALDNLRDLESMAEYAESKDVPAAKQLVPFASGMLFLGSIGIALGRFPRLASGAVAAFLAGVTPMMHDFWNLEEDQRKPQLIHFLKNTAMLGGALILLERDSTVDDSE